jgi:hypothetical protein
VELMSSMSQFLTRVSMARRNALTGGYSMPSRSDCMMLLLSKEASGSRNYPMHSWVFVLNLPSHPDSRTTSWSTALKLYYPPT